MIHRNTRFFKCKYQIKLELELDLVVMVPYWNRATEIKRNWD